MTDTPGKQRNVVVFSLTDNGAAVAQRLVAAMPHLQHVHKSDAFIQTVQAYFAKGTDCVFICATGIVVRAIAPVLQDKHTDPAIVVLDEHGQFAIPLLSGHEGGAGELAYKVAGVLGAQCVVTSHTDYSRPVYAIGMGCDKGCPQSELQLLFDEVREHFDADVTLIALASIDIKREEPSLVAFSQHLQLPFAVYSAQALRRFEQQLSVRSDIVFREVGCYGVAEAAALAAASAATGQAAELVVTKRKNKRATIAVARSYLPS